MEAERVTLSRADSMVLGNRRMKLYELQERESRAQELSRALCAFAAYMVRGWLKCGCVCAHLKHACTPARGEPLARAGNNMRARAQTSKCA